MLKSPTKVQLRQLKELNAVLLTKKEAKLFLYNFNSDMDSIVCFKTNKNEKFQRRTSTNMIPMVRRYLKNTFVALLKSDYDTFKKQL
jgi:hypothetical protein